MAEARHDRQGHACCLPVLVRLSGWSRQTQYRGFSRGRGAVPPRPFREPPQADCIRGMLCGLLVMRCVRPWGLFSHRDFPDSSPTASSSHVRPHLVARSRPRPFPESAWPDARTRTSLGNKTKASRPWKQGTMAGLLGRSIGRPRPPRRLITTQARWTRPGQCRNLSSGAPSGCIRLWVRNLCVLFHDRLKAAGFMSRVQLPHPPYLHTLAAGVLSQYTPPSHMVHMAQRPTAASHWCRSKQPNCQRASIVNVRDETNTRRASPVLADTLGAPDPGRPDRPRIASIVEQHGPLPMMSCLPPAVQADCGQHARRLLRHAATRVRLRRVGACGPNDYASKLWG